jgi:hypothetical protein
MTSSDGEVGNLSCSCKICGPREPLEGNKPSRPEKPTAISAESRGSENDVHHDTISYTPNNRIAQEKTHGSSVSQRPGGTKEEARPDHSADAINKAQDA